MKHTLTSLVLGISLLFGSIEIGYAQDYRKGYTAFKSGDYATALREWRPLAERGIRAAQYNMGLMHKKGLGVVQDPKEAVKWYRRAAEQGLAKGQYNLGEMYRKGEGVVQDSKEAVKWYRRAAEQGHVKGQYNLGLMYSFGLGVVQDYVRAHMWFNLSGSNGDKWGSENRDKIAIRMTPSQISEAQKLARECVRKKYKGC